MYSIQSTLYPNVQSELFALIDVSESRYLAKSENDNQVVVFYIKFQLAQEFANFGSMDVKILDSQHALVAVAQHRR